MEESLNDLRRQIASGLLYLTVPEDDALQALLAVFPQYSMWSLSAVVALHSHQFLSSPDSLVQCCMEFLFGEDGETLTPFLCPWTYNDEPEAFAGGNLQSEASTGSSFATASSSATMGQQLGSAPSSLKAATSNLNLTSSASPTVVKSQPLPSNISATVLMTTSSASASSDFAQATATVTTATVGNPSVMCETLSASAPNTCTSLSKKLHQTSPVTVTPRSADLLPASVSTELTASDSSKTLTEQTAASSNSIVNGPSCLSHTSSPSPQKSTLGSAKPPVFTQTSGSASTSRKHDVSYDAETAMSRDLDSPTASEDSNVSLPVSLHELPASGEASYNRSESCNFLEDSDVAMSATPSPDLPAGLLDSDVSSRESSSDLPMPVLPKQSVAGGSTCTAGVSLSSDLSVIRSPPLVDDDFSISEPAPLNDTDSDISPQESSNELPALPKELKSCGSPSSACVSTPDLSVGKLAPVVAVVTKSSARAGRFGEIQARGGGSWRESSTPSSTSGFGCDFEDDSDELETDASVDRILSSLSSHYKGSSRKPKPQPQTVANLGVHVRGGSLKIELDSMSDSASDKAKPAAVEIFDDSSCDSLPDIAFIVKPKLEAKDVGIKTEPKARNEQSESDGVTSNMYRSKEEIIGSSSDSQHSFSSNGSDLPDLPDFCSQSPSAPKMKSENTGNCSQLAFTGAGGSRHTPAVALRSKRSFSSASQDLSPVSEFSVCSKVKVTKREKLPIDPYNVAQTASSVIGCEGIGSNSGSKKKKIPSANHNLCWVASSLLNKRKATGSKKKAVPAAYEGGPVNRKTSGNTGTACSSFNAESLPSLSPPKRKRPVFNEERPNSSAKTPARPPVSVSHSSRPDMSGSISSGVKYLGKNSSFCGTQVASPTPLPASSSSTAGSGISVFPPSSVHDLASKPGNPYATGSSAKQYMGQIRSNHSPATTRASASTSTAAASATSVSMPDTRDNLQKRMDRLDAQILGLIGTTNSFRADFTSNQPFRGLDQIPDSSLVNTELRSLAPRPRMRTHQSAPARTAVKTMAKMFEESSGLAASSQLSTGKMPTPLKSASIPVSTGYDFAAPVVKSVTVRLVDPPRSVPNKSDSPETRMKTGYVFAAPVGLNPPPSVPNQSDSLPSSSTSLAKPSKKGKSKKTKADATQPAPATGSGSVNTTPAQGNVNTAQSQGNPHTHSVANSSLKGMAKPANTPSLTEAGAAVHRATFGVPTPSSAVVQPPAAGLVSGARPVVNPGIWGWRDKRAGQAAGYDGVINVDSETVLNDSQDSVEILGATPANNIIINDLDLPAPPPSQDVHMRDVHMATAEARPGVIDLRLNAPGTSRMNLANPPAAHQMAPGNGQAYPVHPAPGPPARHPGLDFAVGNVLEVFPGVDRQYVTQLLERYLVAGTLDQALNMTMDYLLDNPQPPPAAVQPGNVQPQNREPAEVTIVHIEKGQPAPDTRDYYKDYSDVSPVHKSITAERLSMEFRLVRMDTINTVLSHYNHHYAPAHRCLSRALDFAMDEFEKQKEVKDLQGQKPSTITLRIQEGQEKEIVKQYSLMKGIRAYYEGKLHANNKELAVEVEFVARQARQHKEEQDRQMAWSLLETEYEEQGQAIECGCCYAEQPFENLVQCFEGHLFCCQCLLGYAREAIFGSGKLNLACMTEDCDSTFPKSQMLKALPDDVLAKYEERLAEESLNMAAMPDLVRCPKCNLAAVLDQRVQNFLCPNATCRKETCRDCKEDWSEHRGKTCEQIEKKDETKFRTNYEEKMTAARVRVCPSCRAEFFKEEGCNKMTCRCGTTMCYICRKQQISYKHFCQHPRDPGKGCTQCQNCSLWTNPDEDERRAIAEIQKEAQEKRKEHGFVDDKVIGVPEKKQRTK